MCVERLSSQETCANAMRRCPVAAPRLLAREDSREAGGSCAPAGRRQPVLSLPFLSNGGVGRTDWTMEERTTGGMRVD